jgi:pyrimidine operon attenuation protein/uracil phosphoribosyltransferase
MNRSEQPPTRGSVLLLDDLALDRTLRRMGQEILERHPGGKGMALIGIPSRGVILAERLGRLMAEMGSGEVPFCGSVDVSMHRDDLHARRRLTAVEPTCLPEQLGGWTVILVDDVLQSGRTCRSAMDSLSSFGRPARIEYAVLMDRGLRELPIAADYVGRRVETAAGERVFVRLRPGDEVEGVWLERKSS